MFLLSDYFIISTETARTLYEELHKLNHIHSFIYFLHGKQNVADVSKLRIQFQEDHSGHPGPIPGRQKIRIQCNSRITHNRVRNQGMSLTPEAGRNYIESIQPADFVLPLETHFKS